MDKPEALRLEDVPRIMDNANAELRRLHEENKLLHERHHDDNVEYTRVLAQRDALLEALRMFVSCAIPVSTKIDERGYGWTQAYLDQALPKARAAIKAAEGEKT